MGAISAHGHCRIFQIDGALRAELRARADAVPFDESKHPRNKGKFASKPGAGAAAEETKPAAKSALPAYPGAKPGSAEEKPFWGHYVTDKGSPKANYEATLNKVIDTPVKPGKPWWTMIAAMAKDADKFFPEEASTVKKILKEKLVETLIAHHASVVAKGKADIAAQLEKKIKALGASVAIPTKVAEKIAEVAPPQKDYVLPGASIKAAKGETIKLAELEKVGPQMGSNKGGVYMDPVSGKQYYAKQLKSAAHKTNEYVAAGLYELAGLKTLSYVPTGEDNVVATKLEPLGKNNVSQLDAYQKNKAQLDFAVHAWLANWDAVGTGGDNQGVIVGQNSPTTLDVGGALEFRAQGGPKGDLFGTKVNELKTMLDPKLSPDAAKFYGGMTPEAMKVSAEKVAHVSDEDIRETVKINGGSPELAEKLIARKFNLAQEFGLQVIEEQEDPEFAAKHPRNPDGTFKQGAALEEWKAAKEKQAAEKPITYSESLKVWEAEQAKKAKEKPATAAEAKKSAFAVGGSPEAIEQVTKYVPGLKQKLDDIANTPGDLEDWEAVEKKAKAVISSGGSFEALQQVLTAPEYHQMVHDYGSAQAGWDAQVEYYEKSTGKKVKAAPKPESKVGFTPEQKAVIEELVAEVESKPKPAKVPPPPEPPKAPPKQPLTADELKKAKKTVALQQQYVPGAPPIPEAQALIDKFNDKYAGKELTSDEALQQKVADFKALVAAMPPLKEWYDKNQQALQAEHAKIAAQKAAKDAAQAAVKNKEIMQQLGISETEAVAFFDLVGMIGYSPKNLAAQFALHEKEAKKYKYPISGFQYALIRNYIDGGYTSINSALRKDAESMSPKHQMYKKIMNDAMAKMPQYKGEVTRGTYLTTAQIAKYKVGEVVEEMGFTSTGIGFSFSGNVHYKIKAIGKRGADFSKGANTGEKEVLFRSNTFFLVKNITKDPVKDKTVIEMEEVEKIA
jgi:hypothetical protein